MEWLIRAGREKLGLVRLGQLGLVRARMDFRGYALAQGLRASTRIWPSACCTTVTILFKTPLGKLSQLVTWQY